MMRKKIGYNVYHAPDGCDPSYYGQVTSLRAARKLAATGRKLARSDWDTARAAGHCAGLEAPGTPGEVEDDEPTAWFGRGGWDYAVAVYAEEASCPAR